MQFELAKPPIVDAVQWLDGELVDGAPVWLKDAMLKKPGVLGSVVQLGNELRVYTEQGMVNVGSTDWVVLDWENDLWVWVDKGFRATFLPVDTHNFAVKTLLDWESYDKAHGR